MPSTSTLCSGDVSQVPWMMNLCSYDLCHCLWHRGKIYIHHLELFSSLFQILGELTVTVIKIFDLAEFLNTLNESFLFILCATLIGSVLAWMILKTFPKLETVPIKCQCFRCIFSRILTELWVVFHDLVASNFGLKFKVQV